MVYMFTRITNTKTISLSSPTSSGISDPPTLRYGGRRF